MSELNNSFDSYDAEMQELYVAYAASFLAKVEQLERLWQTTHKGSDWNTTLLQELHQATYKLIGSSATYGFIQVSQMLRQLEIVLKSLVIYHTPPTKDQEVQIDFLLKTLHQQAFDLKQRDPHQIVNVQQFPPKVAKVGPASQEVWVISSDEGEAQTLAQQISLFGYNVITFSEPDQWETKQAKGLPIAIIIDISWHTQTDYSRLPKHLQKPIPLIFVATNGDLQLRLWTVRAGAVAYFDKPINMSRLAEKLDELAVAEPIQPYRVLIIDDDPVLSGHYTQILRRAGMLTLEVNEPLNFSQPLSDFNPDLILMDMYMPQCSGLELAAVIRQQEAYVSTPIVFLSSETDQAKQMEAMQMGGDDFLSKPILANHLISVVTARVIRSRVLRSFVTRDGLTGLLNHSNLKNQLSLELTKAARYKQSLAFAMLDLDNFKAINDRYGHGVGDQVLGCLSRVLQQRLRRTDIIGRYGGEEFAVMLPNTGIEAACQVLNEIRVNFSQVRQQAPDSDFVVSFSCGIAAYPNFATATLLNEAADKALYEAKQGGRNRVVCAD